jgi:hypothetical protein
MKKNLVHAENRNPARRYTELGVSSYFSFRDGWFESRPGQPSILTEILRGYPQCFHINAGTALKIRQKYTFVSSELYSGFIFVFLMILARNQKTASE